MDWSCNLWTSKIWSWYIQQFRRRCIHKKIHCLTFGLEVKVIQNDAQYPLHYVTYAPAKFEVATSNGLGGDAFTRKYIIWALTLKSRSHKMMLSIPSKPCDLCTCKGWSCYVQWFRRRCIYKKIHYLTGQGHRKCCWVPSTSSELCNCIVWSCYVYWLRRRCIYKKKHYLTFLTLTLGVKVKKVK